MTQDRYRNLQPRRPRHPLSSETNTVVILSGVKRSRKICSCSSAATAFTEKSPAGKGPSIQLARKQKHSCHLERSETEPKDLRLFFGSNSFRREEPSREGPEYPARSETETQLSS